MNTTIVFTVKNRRISSDTKSIELIGDNMDYTAIFDLDEDMAYERIKTARFIKDDEQQERILDDNNSCQIPPELLKKGYISVGIYTDKKSTTPCFLQINRSIRETDYPAIDPEPDVYRQLLEKIEKLKGLREIELRADKKSIQWRYVDEEEWQELISFSDITVPPEEIKKIIEDYLTNNPLKETDPTVPDWAKEPQKPTYTAEEVGALPTSKLPEAIDVALAQAKESGMFDGKDGKDGAPGEKGDPGPKGDPGETTYVENPYDDTLLKNDIGQLKEDKLDKPADPPTTGKILRVKSVNDDGTFVCEWADGGSNVDVRIDGQSIVQDGVAEIPVSAGEKYGVARYSNTLGVMLNTGGYVTLSTASQYAIDKRVHYTNQYGAITSSNVDYAVKAAMTDGKGAAWTADEQVAARERMGIGEWELIADVTLEEDVNSYKIQTQYGYQRIKVLLDNVEDGMNGSFYSYGIIKRVNGNYQPAICIAYGDLSTRYRYGYIGMECVNENVIMVTESSINKNKNNIYGIYDFPNFKQPWYYSDKLYGIEFVPVNETNILKTGTKIQVYGARAQ